MTKSGKFFFVVFHCCECACVCTCTHSTLVSLNTLRILPHCWNLKYQVKPAAATTDYSLLPRLCSLFWPLTRDTRSCNFTPLSVYNCASLACAEAVLTDPWTKAVASLTFNSCPGCLSIFTFPVCRRHVTEVNQKMIYRFLIIVSRQEQRLCDEDGAFVLSQPECSLPELAVTLPWMWVWRPPPSSFCYLSCPARTTLMTSAVKTQRAYVSPPPPRPVLRQIPGGLSWWGGDLRSWGLGRGARGSRCFFFQGS